MAKACPKCARPNNERAQRCIYCGVAMPVEPSPPAKAQQAPPGPKTAESPGSATPSPAPSLEKRRALPEAFLTVVSPSQRPDPSAAAAFGRLLDLDRYTASQKLRHPAAWVARVYPEAGPAQELAAAMNKVGVEAYVVKQTGIDKVSDRVQAMGLVGMDDEKIVLADAQGRQVAIRFDDVFLIVKGRIKQRARREEDVEEDSYTVNVGKLAVPQDIDPGADKSAMRQAVERLAWKPRSTKIRWIMRATTSEVMDIYRKSSPRPIRIMESEFDYSGLGELMTPSGLMNYNMLFKTITKNAENANIDTTWNTVGHSMGETMKEDKVRSELQAALGVSEGEKKLYDNQAFFDDFSARMYLHYLRENSKKKKSS